MRKFLIPALASAALLAAVSAANAWPYCFINYWGYWVCY
jgi:hypothetical protein